MKIRSRYVLVFALAACQTFCLAWGVALFAGWLNGAIRHTVHQQMLSDNLQIAEQLTGLIHEIGLHDIRSDEQEWWRLQRVVADIRLPNEGFVCVVDSGDGALLCHPAFKDRPQAIRNQSKSMPSKSDMPTKKPMSKTKPQRQRASGGIVGEGDDLQVVAAAEIPALNARVLVHQYGRGIDNAVEKIIAPVWPIGLGVTAGSALFSALALILVMRAYDNRLADANEQLEERVEQRTRSLRRTRDAVIFGLAKLAESRDTDTGEHLDRIRLYVTLLAEQLLEEGLLVDRRYIEDLALASSLHDIGKVGIPDRVLLKPGRLEPEERSTMERHAELGGRCLSAIGDRLGEDDFLQLAKEVAYGHHEKWDGSGYPAGVAGERIPLAARIVAVADVYDALRSRRPYKDPMSHDRARSILIEGRGGHFDPVVLEAFLACEDRFAEISDRSNAASPCDHAETSEVLAPA